MIGALGAMALAHSAFTLFSMLGVAVLTALLPSASGLEEGSELLQSVALVLIGGLLTSTLLRLVFVPAMYTVFDDLE
jgi:multidrug efflux pump subunit AcrB